MSILDYDWTIMLKKGDALHEYFTQIIHEYIAVSEINKKTTLATCKIYVCRNIKPWISSYNEVCLSFIFLHHCKVNFTIQVY